MRIRFTEDIELCVGRELSSRKRERRKFSADEMVEVEFLGEDSDLTTIDFVLPDGPVALGVPRHVVEIVASR
jgi:hypothetical protein